MTRRFTTAALEALTEDTAEGPWQTKFTGYIIGTAGRPIVEWNTVGDKSTSLPNAHLIAAAPELAAELHRIRREFEERIRVWQKVEDKLEASGDTDVAEVMRYVGRSAARILNGDNHE